MAELAIFWDGDSPEAFARKLLIADRRLENMRPVLEDIRSEVIIPGMKETFERGGRPQWRRLATSTIERKSRLGGLNAHRKLVRSGLLEKRVQYKVTYPIKKNTMTSDLDAAPYWRFHQEGDGVPQRVILKLTEQDQRHAARLFLVHVATIMETSLRTTAAKFVRIP